MENIIMLILGVLIHKSAFSGHKSFNSHSFCPLSRPGSRHFALLDAVLQPHTGQSADFPA